MAVADVRHGESQAALVAVVVTGVRGAVLGIPGIPGVDERADVLLEGARRTLRHRAGQVQFGVDRQADVLALQARQGDLHDVLRGRAPVGRPGDDRRGAALRAMLLGIGKAEVVEPLVSQDIEHPILLRVAQLAERRVCRRGVARPVDHRRRRILPLGLGVGVVEALDEVFALLRAIEVAVLRQRDIHRVEGGACPHELDARLHLRLRVDPGHDRRVDHAASHLARSHDDVDRLRTVGERRGLHRPLRRRRVGIGLKLHVAARGKFQRASRGRLARALHADQATGQVGRQNRARQPGAIPVDSHAGIQMQVALRGHPARDDDRLDGIGQHPRGGGAVVVVDEAVDPDVLGDQLDRARRQHLPATGHEQVAGRPGVDQAVGPGDANAATAQDADLRGLDPHEALGEDVALEIEGLRGRDPHGAGVDDRHVSLDPRLADTPFDQQLLRPAQADAAAVAGVQHAGGGQVDAEVRVVCTGRERQFVIRLHEAVDLQEFSCRERDVGVVVHRGHEAVQVHVEVGGDRNRAGRRRHQRARAGGVGLDDAHVVGDDHADRRRAAGHPDVERAGRLERATDVRQHAARVVALAAERKHLLDVQGDVRLLAGPGNAAIAHVDAAADAADDIEVVGVDADTRAVAGREHLAARPHRDLRRRDHEPATRGDHAGLLGHRAGDQLRRADGEVRRFDV